ncbi:hypothetical protein SAMN05216354_0458 [Xylanibacter ruminicola]|uniref:Uncharacterized protein n=1 Tax=Xylanibacter ruminicola TaxID=839 RepID=A0A1H5S3L6_XYLRU|nr:hypothetical protein SAMN05216354_0458 [Xylanibacter ruminicola]
MQGSTLHFSIIPSLVHFLSSPKENGTKRKVRKRPGSEAGCPIFVIIQRTRFAQTAFHVDLLSLLRNSRIEEDSENSTTSKDLFVRNVFEDLSEKTCSTKCGARLCRLLPKGRKTRLCRLACPRMFSRIYPRKHVARSAVTALLLRLSKHPWQRRAFSVVG